MNKLKAWLVDHGYELADDAADDAIKAAAQTAIADGTLSLEKYAELIQTKSETSRIDELASSIVKGVQDANADLVKQLTAVLKPVEKPEPVEKKTEKAEEKDDFTEVLKKLNELESKMKTVGHDGATANVEKLLATEEKQEPNVRVKCEVENYGHTPTALTYKSKRSALMGLKDTPVQYNGHDVNLPTDRTKLLSATWVKFQLFPELLTEREKSIIQWTLDHERFLVPNAKNDTRGRMLTDAEKKDVWKGHMDFYSKAVINDGTSGGQSAVPEFFDMDMIVTPTLAMEDIPSYCNIVPVARGSAAQNFVIGRPTVAAANTEGSATALFTTTSFITNHDTTFFRAAGFIEIGRNFAEDAHPGLVMEIQNQYMNSVKLWLNEQIMAGDGTTEPQGVTVASGTGDITPANPTTGALTLNDAFDVLFGVGKAYRENGGRRNAIYCMTDTTYQRFRRIATGVTGDTRLVFGDDVESYQMFGHPVLIEETGLTNQDIVFFQAKGYRLYQRQGARFVREDRGDTLVRANSFIVGVDVRYGGQLDEGAYAAVIDAAPA